MTLAEPVVVSIPVGTGNSPPARNDADSPEIAREGRLGEGPDHAGLLEGAERAVDVVALAVGVAEALPFESGAEPATANGLRVSRAATMPEPVAAAVMSTPSCLAMLRWTSATVTLS